MFIVIDFCCQYTDESCCYDNVDDHDCTSVSFDDSVLSPTLYPFAYISKVKLSEKQVKLHLNKNSEAPMRGNAVLS